jgi:hypothetical protein
MAASPPNWGVRDVWSGGAICAVDGAICTVGAVCAADRTICAAAINSISKITFGGRWID